MDGNNKRLSDHLQNHRLVQQHLQSVKEQHMQRHTVDELQFYPAHEGRTETPEYKAAHKHLVEELNLPCLVCGVRHSTLGDPNENKYGAKQLETHHHIIEWALQNAVDVNKFNKIIRPHLEHRHPDKPEYKTDFTEAQIKAWVDHSEDNLWVLCDVHHRHQYFGIHEITYPIWVPMDLLKDDFEDWVKTEIDNTAKSARKQPLKPKSED